MDQIVEQWRPVVGWEGLYEVSDQGQVRTVERRVRNGVGLRLVRSRIRRQHPHNVGSQTYWTVNLSVLRDGVSRGGTASVHRLVLEAFKGPCPHGMEARHGLGGSLDNTLKNLRWGSPSENNLEDKLRDGTLVRGENHCAAKLTARQVKMIRADKRSYESIAADHGISFGNVGLIKRRKTWAHVD